MEQAGKIATINPKIYAIYLLRRMRQQKIPPLAKLIPLSQNENSTKILRVMKFEVVDVSRGDIRLKSEGRFVRVLGEAMLASTPTDPSYIIYLSSLNNCDEPPSVALTKAETQDIIRAIHIHFQGRFDN